MSENEEPDTGTATAEEKQTAPAEMYQIVLLDDNDHTAEYVVEMVTTLFQTPMPRAHEIVLEVHYMGRSVVKVCALADALRGRDAILAFGPDPRIPRCASSMRARIEPVLD